MNGKISSNLANECSKAHIRELENLSFAIDQHAIVSIADTAGDIIAVNQRFSDISGYSHDELLGKNHRLLNSGRHPQSFLLQCGRRLLQA